MEKHLRGRLFYWLFSTPRKMYLHSFPHEKYIIPELLYIFWINKKNNKLLCIHRLYRDNIEYTNKLFHYSFINITSFLLHYIRSISLLFNLLWIYFIIYYMVSLLFLSHAEWEHRSLKLYTRVCICNVVHCFWLLTYKIQNRVVFILI